MLGKRKRDHEQGQAEFTRKDVTSILRMLQHLKKTGTHIDCLLPLTSTSCSEGYSLVRHPLGYECCERSVSSTPHEERKKATEAGISQKDKGVKMQEAPSQPPQSQVP